MENITFNDWAKLDLRVGEIVEVEDIENADKLYKLSVDVGEENPRTLCAGIKQYYTKEELKGKKIIVFCNLEPRVMRGIESKGMLLAASTENHENVILLSPEKDIEVGSKVS
jgi:methionine--tRNA ligase beta chain